MLIFFLFLIQLSISHQICHVDNTDLCIGYSDFLKNGTALQLKSRLSLQKKNNTE